MDIGRRAALPLAAQPLERIFRAAGAPASVPPQRWAATGAFRT